MTEQTPLDRFKQALTGTARAIAQEPEVEVAWSADSPTQSGKNFRVPLPGRTLPPEQAREARGFADSFALKLRHHNESVHAKGAPPEPIARACYDAIERVRYEAVGSTRYSGMKANLDSAVELRTASDPIARATEAKEVPLPTALSLMLRSARPEVRRSAFTLLNFSPEDFPVTERQELLKLGTNAKGARFMLLRIALAMNLAQEYYGNLASVVGHQCGRLLSERVVYFLLGGKSTGWEDTLNARIKRLEDDCVYGKDALRYGGAADPNLGVVDDLKALKDYGNRVDHEELDDVLPEEKPDIVHRAFRVASRVLEIAKQP